MFLRDEAPRRNEANACGPDVWILKGRLLHEGKSASKKSGTTRREVASRVAEDHKCNIRFIAHILHRCCRFGDRGDHPRTVECCLRRLRMHPADKQVHRFQHPGPATKKAG